MAANLEQLLQEQSKIHGILQEWMTQQCTMQESLLLSQRQLVDKLASAHDNIRACASVSGELKKVDVTEQNMQPAAPVQAEDMLARALKALGTSSESVDEAGAPLRIESVHSESDLPGATFQKVEAQTSAPTQGTARGRLSLPGDPSQIPEAQTSTPSQGSRGSMTLPSGQARGRLSLTSLDSYSSNCSWVGELPDLSSSRLRSARSSVSSISSHLSHMPRKQETSDEDTLDDKFEREEANTQKDDDLLDLWRRTSGLHTVDRWVTNYRHHSAGDAALLLIHGVDKVCDRLRNKVENYCIYSALFLSTAFTGLCAPSEFWIKTETFEEGSEAWWAARCRERVYIYAFMAGSASHLLAIVLGMSFINALNDTARDSDVYRMFARGNAFSATRKCQISFRLGCLLDFIAVGAACTFMVTWIEILVIFFVMIFIGYRVFLRTANDLFQSASIVHYWREELGGKPDEDDPYDLNIAISAFKRRVLFERNVLMADREFEDQQVPMQKTATGTEKFFKAIAAS